ncbi:DUF1405 domain-containing protein [Paenibacillus cremeus]|uniref:DUF1405 domain-containing protein n=1 Tax=Paenibacillus cremeus TaxID=2163881 RepID=A0A559KHS9_9BACL|nr:DUF1405 domain-containing protein [Paenibacillus cremeus]TVY11638.1 DUF1405 domain-containing protein [Paenibacillus cremeus]
MLWSLFWVNLLGTIYGYEWYWKQLVYTAQEISPWLLPFVPDSPTASLFFTFVLIYLLIESKRNDDQSNKPAGIVRGFVEAFAVITSFKYGIWAVSMIMASAYQGDSLVWQDWMLSISHLGMAAEALLYFAFYRYRWSSVVLAAAWAFLNDYMDYTAGVFPWLPEVLMDDLPAVETFTISLSVVSAVVAMVMWLIRELRAFSPRKSV